MPSALPLAACGVPGLQRVTSPASVAAAGHEGNGLPNVREHDQRARPERSRGF